MKPAPITAQRDGPTLSCRNSTANTTMKSGDARLIAVALASGRWNIAPRYSKVPQASTLARNTTQRPPTSRRRDVAPNPCATASTRSVAITPRKKMSCAAGMPWLTYLTNPSLRMKHAIAPDMQRMPRRLAAISV